MSLSLRSIRRSLEKLTQPQQHAAPVRNGQTARSGARQPSPSGSLDTFATTRARSTIAAAAITGALPPQYAMSPRPAPSYDADKADRIVRGLYRGVLGREVDPSGHETYKPLVEQGQLAVVVNALVQSDEFRARAATVDAGQLSTDLYRGILGRDPDPEGHAATVDAINAGITAYRAFDMVASPESAERLSAPETSPVDPEVGNAKRTGRVRAEGSSFADDGGKFNGLGATMMWAAWAYKHDRAKLEQELETLSKNGFGYIRALGTVGDYEKNDYWEGREIDWRDPAYKETIAGLTDLAYDKYGLRVEWTLIGDGQLNIPKESDRYKLADTFLEMSQGREHKIMHFEVANEAWQNGFSGDDGAKQLRELTKYLNDRTDILVASSAPPGGTPEDVKAYYEGGVADVGTFHFDRDVSKTEGHWRPVRQPWEYRYDPTLPKLGSNNEPIGPGASVASENDPKRLLTSALVSYVSNVGSYVWHTRAGVRGDESFSTMAGLDAFRVMKKYVPDDLSSWSPKNGHWADAPFRPYARLASGELKPDTMWTDEKGSTGAVRVYSAVKGDEFFTVPFGLNGPLTLEPRRNVELDVIDPMTGEVLEHKFVAAGQKFELSGDEVFVLKGRYV